MSAAGSEKTSLDNSPNASGSVNHNGQRIVQLEELSAADRALAEQFGYQPVRYRCYAMCNAVFWVLLATCSFGQSIPPPRPPFLQLELCY